jgi:alpha-L-fucosidase
MKAVGESYGDAQPASHLSENHNVMLTRRGNSLYVHLHTVPMTDAVKLKPFTTAPKRAVLLNKGSELPLSTELCPADHQSQTGYLRVRGIPADSLANTVGVIRLDFENLDAAARKTSSKNDDGIRTR